MRCRRATPSRTAPTMPVGNSSTEPMNSAPKKYDQMSGNASLKPLLALRGSKMMVPFWGLVLPVMMSSRVVLPAPLGR